MFEFPHSFYRKIRQKGTSKFHAQLCIALFCMLFFFLVGIDRTENKGVCTTFSLLIQYFTMASVTLMGAEAIIMFHKLIIVFGGLHLIAISVIAWGRPSSLHLKFILWYTAIFFLYFSYTSSISHHWFDYSSHWGKLSYIRRKVVSPEFVHFNKRNENSKTHCIYLAYFISHLKE